MVEENLDFDKSVLIQLKSEDGKKVGNCIDIPRKVNLHQLRLICNALLQKDNNISYSFFVNNKEIISTLESVLDLEKLSSEHIVDVIFQEQAQFKVRPVSRCSSSLPGHSEAVISVQFSPDSSKLASGSGDACVRFWDIQTHTPLHLCTGHKNWVLCIAWSPDSKCLVSACRNGILMSWNPLTGKKFGPDMIGHKQWVTAISWEPYHLNKSCRRFASSGKDGSVRVWDVTIGHCLKILTSHSHSVTCVKWGGSGLIYSGSQDRTIKVWRVEDGILCRTLHGHGHWINTLTLNTDYALRTAVVNFESTDDSEEKLAIKKYEDVIHRTNGEVLVSGSDDFTLMLWRPESSNKFVARMTGHQQLINCVQFSPDSRLIASASFDKSIKLWDGNTGKFLTTLYGHVRAVYMIAWSCDSRLIVSGSADSTLKVWDVKSKKIIHDLPGHADEVFAVDWAPTGQLVASGGKDKILKLWQN